MLASRRFLAWTLSLALLISLGSIIAWRTTAAPAAASQPPATSTSAASSSASTDAAAAARIEASARAAREATLTTALTNLRGSTGVDFAVTLEDHVTGETYSFHSGEAFETASIVKVEILAALLLQNNGALTASQQALANVMIRESDNDAASALWDQIGDAAGLAQANATLGLTSTVPGEDGYWGLTTTTSADQAHLIDAVSAADGPLGSARTTLTELMGSVITDQAWGISAAATSGESFILKNGWMTRSDDSDRWEVNSIGRITGTGTDLTLAVMSSGNATSASGIAVIEQIAQLVRSQLQA